MYDHGVISGVSIPVLDGAKSMGVLSAHSRLPQRFTMQDARFLSSMAGILTSAICRSHRDRALREREAQFRGVFDSDLVGIIFWTSDGVITDANDAFLSMAGYDR